ncbi:unnamed protein product, partial [marine sediment metagenome]
KNSGVSIPVIHPNESLQADRKVEIKNFTGRRLRVRERNGVIIFDLEAIVDISGGRNPK